MYYDVTEENIKQTLLLNDFIYKEDSLWLKHKTEDIYIKLSNMVYKEHLKVINIYEASTQNSEKFIKTTSLNTFIAFIKEHIYHFEKIPYQTEHDYFAEKYSRFSNILNNLDFSYYEKLTKNHEAFALMKDGKEYLANKENADKLVEVSKILETLEEFVME